MPRDHSLWVNITQQYKSAGLESESRGSHSGSATFRSCVILDKLLKLSVPQFPYLRGGFKNGASCRGSKRIKWNMSSTLNSVRPRGKPSINTGFCYVRCFHTRLKQQELLLKPNSPTSCGQTSGSYFRNNPSYLHPFTPTTPGSSYQPKLPVTSF